MSVRARYHIDVALSSTDAEEKDLANISMEVVTDELGEAGVRKFTLAAGATDVAVSLGNVTTSRLLVIRTLAADPTEDPVEITVKRNTTGNEALPVTPLPSTREGHFHLSTSGLTALYASNPGAVDMVLTVLNAGD